MSFDAEELTNDPQFQSFVEEKVQTQRLHNLTVKLTDKCWDLCMEKPSPRLEQRTETCLVGCVERFLDSTHFILSRLEKVKKPLGSSSSELLSD